MKTKKSNKAKEIEGKLWIIFYKDHCKFGAKFLTDEAPLAPIVNVAIGFVEYEDDEVIRMIFEGDSQGDMGGLLILKSTITGMVELKPTLDGAKIMKAMKVDLFEKIREPS
jgi:hypothetical protein